MSARAGIAYANWKGERSEFPQAVYEALEASCTVREAFGSSFARGQDMHKGELAPWLYIAFLFPSMTIATSILSQFGADVYARLKDNVTILTDRKALPIVLRLEVRTSEERITVRGQARGDSVEILGAIKGAGQLIHHVEERQKRASAARKLKKEHSYIYEAAEERWKGSHERKRLVRPGEARE